MLRVQLSLSLARCRTFVTSSSGGKKKKKVSLGELLSAMPKEETHLKDLMEKRLVKRSKRVLSQPAKISWQVLGSGARGGPSSLLLHTDHRRYLFNCGEGTQRLTSQLALSRTLAQLEHVFITSKSWANLGGLPGMCLSARSSGAPDITIHGPPGCMELYEATKGFILLFNFEVLRHRLEDGEYTDGAVTVRSVQLCRSQATTAPGLVAPWDGLTEEQSREGGVNYEDSAVAYICSFSPKPGKLDPVACVDLGVPPGPLLGQLKAGQDVTLKCGKLVRASDVVAQAAPPTADLVLEVPDLHYLDSLEAAKELVDIPNLRTVFHLSPSEVVRSPRYRSWMAGLGSQVNHVLINEDSRGLGLPDVTAYQHKLRMVRGDLFPALLGAGDPKLGMRELAAELAREVPGAGPVVQASSGLRVTVRAGVRETVGVDLAMALPFRPGQATSELLEGGDKLHFQDRKDYRKGMQEDLEAARTYSPPPEATRSPSRSPSSKSPSSPSPTPFITADTPEARASLSYWGEKRRKLSLAEKLKVIDGVSSVTAASEGPDTTVDGGGDGSYPVVTFLGTGSSVPSKYRNVSSILVETAPGSWLLLDCGEGSLGQLVRIKGWDGAMAVLRGLRAVYVSHLHADHHLGAINIILHREAAFREAGLAVAPLKIVATRRLGEFLTYYHSKLQPILCHAELVEAEHLLSYKDEGQVGGRVQTIYPDRLAALLSGLGLSQMATCRAIHCPHAFCLVLTTSSGYKLAYSGDTRPNAAFRELCSLGGSGPDLLIHEATMEHFMINDAKIKKHTTITEAIEEGEAMGAGFTLLTHFSQRYAKMPPLEELRGRSRLGIAFDNMVVTPALLHYIPSIYPAISRWMWEHCEEMERKGEVYKQKYCEDFQVGDGVRLEGFQSPLEEQQEVLEQLDKKHRQKEELHGRINRKKLLMASRGASRSPSPLELEDS